MIEGQNKSTSNIIIIQESVPSGKRMDPPPLTTT